MHSIISCISMEMLHDRWNIDETASCSSSCGKFCIYVLRSTLFSSSSVKFPDSRLMTGWMLARRTRQRKVSCIARSLCTLAWLQVQHTNAHLGPGIIGIQKGTVFAGNRRSPSGKVEDVTRLTRVCQAEAKLGSHMWPESTTSLRKWWDVAKVVEGSAFDWILCVYLRAGTKLLHNNTQTTRDLQRHRTQRSYTTPIPTYIHIPIIIPCSCSSRRSDTPSKDVKGLS